jgi:hypothetical protein
VDPIDDDMHMRVWLVLVADDQRLLMIIVMMIANTSILMTVTNIFLVFYKPHMICGPMGENLNGNLKKLQMIII